MGQCSVSLLITPGLGDLRSSIPETVRYCLFDCRTWQELKKKKKILSFFLCWKRSWWVANICFSSAGVLLELPLEYNPDSFKPFFVLLQENSKVNWESRANWQIQSWWYSIWLQCSSFCLDYTRTRFTYDLPWNHIQTQSSIVKPHPTGGRFLSLSLFHTHPPTAVLRGANQRKGGLSHSENLFSHNLSCKSNFKNPGCNEVNTWTRVVFRCWQWCLTQFECFLSCCLGKSRLSVPSTGK